MSLDSDAVIDRRKLKRRLGWWRLAAIVAVTAGALVLLARDQDIVPRDYVAQIDVEGIIVEDAARDRQLERIARDEHAQALIVTINSPGGTVVGGETLYKKLRDVSAKKPVVAVMGTLATSGGYMTAIGADYILAHGGTVTGSIGVILQSTDVTGLLKKLGIEAEAIKSSPLKAVPNPFEPLTEAGRAATRAVVLDMFEQFIALVAKRRKMSDSEVRGVADGRIFTGRQALAVRLIDGIGGRDEAREWLKTNHNVAKSLPVRRFRPPEEGEFSLRLARQLVGKVLFSERLTLDGLVSVWHPDAK